MPLRPLPFRLKLPGRDTVSFTQMTSVSYRVKGLLHMDGDAITLEWAAIRKTEGITLTEVVDSVDYSPMATVALRASWIAEARVTGGWWAPRLRLRASQLDVFRLIPGALGRSLALRIHRRDRKHARTVAAAIASARDDRLG